MRCHPNLKEEDRAYFEQKAKNLKRQKLDATGAIYGETKELDSSIIQNASLNAQLLVYCRYIFDGRMKEEFLFLSYFETTTTAYDVIDIISAYFMRHELTRVRERAPQATCIHRFVYREALASKSLPAKLNVLFKKIVKVALRNERKAFLQEQKKRDLLEVYSIKYFEA
ncbi:SCAN domain-containing protein [Trichinella spiralis]|uniref:SCAN domain-containing protein n=1 Tax=Trichinella spiralis TaxID=6334 RepID=A0ABR3KT99_TRISP